MRWNQETPHLPGAMLPPRLQCRWGWNGGLRAAKQPAQCHTATNWQTGDSDRVLFEPRDPALMYAALITSLVGANSLKSQYHCSDILSVPVTKFSFPSLLRSFCPILSGPGLVQGGVLTVLSPSRTLCGQHLTEGSILLNLSYP